MELSKPLMKLEDQWLSIENYFKILTETEEIHCTSTPPVNPQPGEIFIYKNKNKEDWKSDQHRWKHTGIKHLPNKFPILTCNYYKCYKGKGFYKRAYILYEKGQLYAEITLIHYVGTLKYVQHEAHGNRKHNLNRSHVMTAKSQLLKQKSNLDMAPHKAYKQLVTEDVHSALGSVLLPRDSKQVSNTIVNERSKRLLSKDDIIGLYILNEELDGFVAKLELLPNFYCILYKNSSLNFFLKIIDIKPCILQYDTTFNLGNFYVSPLTYRYSVFKKEPVIPLFYLVHDTKKKEVHKNFFTFIVQLCPGIHGKIIITDREAAIVAVIKDILPNSHHFVCWNHIQQDVKAWLYKHSNCDLGDRVVYTQHVWDLLDSDSEHEFNEKLDVMKEQWSKSFRGYFLKNLYDDIKKSGKWVLINYDIYIQRSGITINAAESFNAVLKRCVDNAQVQAQVLALVLFQLDLYYQKEILRGFCNCGNYSLKENFKHLQIDPKNAIYPTTNLPLQKLPYIFYNKDFTRETGDDDEEQPYTKYSVAKMLVLQNKVRLVTEEQIFIISGEKNKEMVKLYPKETCTCIAKRHCHHITAAKISIGLEENKQRDIKLTNIVHKKRGFKSGKKKPPNITVVEAAADANASKIENKNTTLLVPTIGKSNILKSRFTAPFHSDRSRSQLNNSLTYEKVFNDEENLEEIKTSTPKENKKKICSVSSIEKDNEMCTFSEKIKRNKQFIIYGRPIYPSELDSLVPKAATCPEDYYLVDSVLDVYPPILYHEEQHNLNHVTVFAAEGFLLNNLNLENSFQFGCQYFLQHKIPEKDIVFFPITYQNHITVIFVIRKLKIILYLDSLGGVSKLHIISIIKLYSVYETFRNLNFNLEDWKIYSPKDIPMQTNSVDCGVYCCLLMEITIRQKKELLYKLSDIPFYRTQIKNKIKQYMEFPIPAPSKASYNKKKILAVEEPALHDVEITCDLPYKCDTVTFLANVVKNYWDETSMICHYGTSCKRGEGTLVLCSKCDHWYHTTCEDFIKKKLPRNYICKRCFK